MARNVDRLTDRAVKAKKAKGLYPDGNGLYLQVSATGSRSWVFRFKRAGKARDMGLGSFPTVGLADARQKAKEARAHRDSGRDPIVERDAAEARKRLADARATTFQQCAEQLIASKETGWKNEKHRAQWRSTLETYAYPVLGHVAVADVDTDLVLKVLEPIWASKTETASRVRGRIERVLSSAKSRGLRQGENPAAWRGHLSNILAQRGKVRHHPALKWSEIPAFMVRLRACDGITPRALEFTVLTAVRTSETLGAQFDEFDLAARVWRIPAERMKAGQEHRVPLSPRAVAIVKAMAAEKLNDFVFPGAKRDSPLSDMTMLMLVRELHAGITVHGFRSSFRDWAGEATKHPHDVCEAALAHTRKDKTHAAYQRGDLFKKRRQLMDAWARYCDKKGARRRRPPQQATATTGKSRVRAGLPIPQPIRQPAARA